MQLKNIQNKCLVYNIINKPIKKILVSSVLTVVFILNVEKYPDINKEMCNMIETKNNNFRHNI